MKGFRTGRRVAWGLLLALPLAAAAAPPPGAGGESAAIGRAGVSGPQSARDEAARPGAFCLPGGCRPAAAPVWHGAAFGATVIAIGWRARRRPSASA